MKRALLILLALCSGCAATYTGIQKQDDGSYLVTRTKAGFMGATKGAIFHCTALQPAGMRCIEIDSP